MFTVISLGAGVQSSVLAMMVAKGMFPKWNVRAAIFADTQAEPKEVYKWLNWLEQRLPFPVYNVTQGSLAEDSLVLRRSKKTGEVYQKTYVPFYHKKPDGTTGMTIRKCTYDYKIVPVIRAVRKMVGGGIFGIGAENTRKTIRLNHSYESLSGYRPTSGNAPNRQENRGFSMPTLCLNLELRASNA